MTNNSCRKKNIKIYYFATFLIIKENNIKLHNVGRAVGYIDLLSIQNPLLRGSKKIKPPTSPSLNPNSSVAANLPPLSMASTYAGMSSAASLSSQKQLSSCSFVRRHNVLRISAMANELHFNKDGSALQVTFQSYLLCCVILTRLINIHLFRLSSSCPKRRLLSLSLCVVDDVSHSDHPYACRWRTEREPEAVAADD